MITWVYVRRAGSARLRRFAVLLSAVLAAVLMVTLAEIPASAAPSVPQQVTPDPAVTEAADIPSARATARVLGHRIEALSERTEASSTYVNPDGTATSELNVAPVRVRRGDAWLPVDLTLVKGSDGVIRPRTHPRDLALAGAGTSGQPRDLASVRFGDSEIALQWRGPLPEPVLTGDRATYLNVLPGADLVVQATRTGFEQSVILKARPLGGLRLNLPLRTKGVIAQRRADGNTDLVDAAGTVVGAVPAPDMWDATVDVAAQVPARKVPVAQQLGARPDGFDLTLVPDLRFLLDPATRYPVTIDPSVSVVYNSFDTFTQSSIANTDQSTQTELRLGTYNGGTTKARSYLHFDMAPFRGKRVLGATMWLYATHSYSCSARNWEVWSSPLVGTGTRWSNQPAPWTRYALTSATRGYTASCDDGWVGTDIRGLAQAWSDQGFTTAGVMLKAENENDSFGWKKFSSGEGGAVPHIDITYNSRPDAAVGLDVSDRGGSGGAVFTRSLTPTLSFRAGDPDGDPVTAVFYVYDADGTVVHDQWVSGVPSGTVARWQVPAGMLQEGRSYRFRATTFDDHDFADDAWQVLRSVHSGQVVDVNGCGFANGTRVQQWPQNGADCQRFFPQGTGDGYYQFRVRHSNQVIDNGGCGTANGNPLITYNQVFGDCQKFAINRLGGGVYSFTVRNAGKVMDQGCSTNGASVIYIWDRLDNNCQRFRLEPAPSNGATVQWLDYTVDTTAPGAPFVSSADYPNDNLWHGAAGRAGTFTFTPPSGTTDTAAYVWGLDVTPATEAVADTAGRATAQVTPTADGQHVLNVRTKDRAGHLSAVASYAFQVGRAGLIRPTDGARVPRRTLLEVDHQPDLTHVRYVYRRGEGAAVETDVPAANLARIDGTPFGAGWVPLSTGPAVWSAADTVGAGAGVVQVKAVVATNGAGAGAYSTAWRTFVVDPDADGAAGSEVGPGSVNLLTGDYSLDAQDVEEFGLTVSRTSSSRDQKTGMQTQRERFTVNQQKVSVDTAGFVPTNTVLTRVTDRGHTGTDSLSVAASPGGTDTWAAVEGDAGALRLGMRPGRTYRLSGWVYVPGSTGLAPPDAHGLRLGGITRTPAGLQEVLSPAPAVTDAWVQLSLDMTVPADATEAFVRLYNGFAGPGRPVLFDDLSLRELTAPFGPQWSSGTAADAAGVDYTRLMFEADTADTVVRIESADGSSVWFTRALDGRFFPEPGAEDLTLAPQGADYRLTELDGTVTVFAQQAGSTAYLVSATTPPVQASTTRYAYELVDDRLRVRRVIAPTETGVGDCTTPTPARGCEALEYGYAASTTATATAFGDVLDQVRAISVWTTDPADGSVALTEVSRYAYDDRGRLREVWDPRTSPVLKIRYDYDDAGRVITLTPPGELAWRFDHGQAGPADDPNAGRLLRVRREALRSGTLDQVDGEIATTVVYGVPLTRAAGGPYDLDGAAVATWAQTEAPTDAVALFGPEDPVGVSTATGASPGADGYRAATVHYLDGSGRAVNVATPGGWIDTAAYDRFGNVVRTLDATNRNLALTMTAGNDELGLAQYDTATRATWLDSQSTFGKDGIDQVRAVGPLHRVVLPEAPDTLVNARLVAENTYDENKPDGAAYHLVTSTRSYAQVVGRVGEYDPRLTRSGYAPAIGGTSGWGLRSPTSVTVNLKVPETAAGAADEALTSYVRYDDRGRALESRKPGSSGTDAATTRSVFWTAGANPDDGACGNRPEWAGQPCLTRAAGAVTGHDAARMPGDLPVKRVTAYNRFGDPTVVTETAAGQTRTTTTAYDPVGRVTSVAITGTLGDPIQTVSTTYDAASGDATATRFADGTVLGRVFDKLGRLARYTDADGAFTATEFDRFGKPSRITDSIGTSQTMAYDRAREPRGLLTSVTDSVAGTFEATYGPDGQVTRLAMPAGVVMDQRHDATGTPVSRIYTGTTAGSPVFASSASTLTIHGQVARHTGPGSDQRYTYDTKGRLVRAVDVDAATGACTTRAYTHDQHANRTGRTVRAGTSNGLCPDDTVGPVSVSAHAYDSADRITDAGYRYDGFGRITTLPSAGGEVVQTFHVNDLIASQTQADQRVSWSLDPAFRSRTYRSERLVNGAWANAVTKVNHYGDDSDEPRWITEDVTLPDSVTRNVSGFDGALMATTAKTGGTTLQMTNLHSDVMATVPLTGTAAGSWGAVTVLDSDEFGVPKSPAAAAARYGWLGGAQRSGDALGDTLLMGARVYHPGSGRFLSPDPVPGGNASTYDYCAADPVNCTDLDGRWGWLTQAIGIVARVAEVAAWIPGPIGAAAGAVSAVAYAVTGNRRKALEMGLVAAANLVGAGSAVKIGFAAARYGARALRAAPRLLKRTRAAASCPINSFTPETLVLLADGTTRPISDLVAGDLVAATDPVSGETTAQPVLEVIVGYGDKHLIEIDIDPPFPDVMSETHLADSASDGDRRPLTATANHPIWIDGQGWVEAGRIGRGVRVLMPGGVTVAIRDVRDIGMVPNRLVYNLTIGNLHTFTVVSGGGTAVLTHNKSVCNVRANKAAGDAARDRLAAALRSTGADVRTEVYKRTPLGKRFIDIEVRRNGVLLGGIEVKTGNSRYRSAQRAKDAWLRVTRGYNVTVVRVPRGR